MNTSAIGFSFLRMRPLLAGAALTALLAGCTSSKLQHPTKSQDAAVYNTQLGVQYMNQGDLSLAKEKLDRAVQQDPDSPSVHSARAMLYVRMREPDKADGEFRQALRLAPDDPSVINSYAVWLCQQGRTDEGVKRFNQAAQNALYKTPEIAYTNAGVCQRAAKRDEEARANFTKALQMRPSFAEAAYQLATLQFDHKEFAAARAQIDGYLGAYPETADLLLLGVRVARAQKDPLAAQRYARKLQMGFPGTDQAKALASLDRNPG
jgi:type IV pilus assembly protein PilF